MALFAFGSSTRERLVAANAAPKATTQGPKGLLDCWPASCTSREGPGVAAGFKEGGGSVTDNDEGHSHIGHRLFLRTELARSCCHRTTRIPALLQGGQQQRLFLLRLPLRMHPPLWLHVGCSPYHIKPALHWVCLKPL